jgi:hypothetical protein
MRHPAPSSASIALKSQDQFGRRRRGDSCGILKKENKMTERKILTKHPLGKSGKNISKQNYETLKEAILSALRNKEITHTELQDQLNKSLKGKFSGNISWYGETVKLDLEARKIIEGTSSKPQKYRLK